MTTQEKKLHQIITVAHQDYEKVLKTHAFFRLHNRTVSEDLVQDTFIKTWSYLIKGGKIEMMKAFLYHVLNNLIVDQYRKHKTSSLDVLLEKGYDPSTNDSSQLINFLDGKEAIHLIQSLPSAYQKVMHMRYTKNLSIGEIADVTGQSRNTVAVQIHRGLGKLKLLYNHV